MNVSELMTANPVLVHEQTAIAECAQILSTRRFRHLPMVDAKGRISGVVTDFGVFRLGGLAGASGELWVPFDDAATALTAVDVAESARVLARPDEALETLLHRLALAPEDLAVVVDEDSRPVGVVSEHDGVRFAQGLGPLPQQVGAVATRPVVCVGASHPAQAAWALMLERHARHVAVVDNRRRLVGVISYRDLIEDDVASGRELTCLQVIRNEETVTVAADTPLPEAAALMARHRYGCLPVLDEHDAPVAILTRTDLILAAVQSLQDEALFDEIE